MTELRIERKPAFTVVGRKTFITGQDNEQFARFWQSAHESGLISALRGHRAGVPGAATNALTLGLSCVEADPENRAFDFYIGCELSGEAPKDMETHSVPACLWAIFSDRAGTPEALIQAEMKAFFEWLPESGYRHAAAPEIEVYPIDSSVEFWLPIVKKEERD